MNRGVVDWVRATLPPELIRGKRVLDVGSLDWNGSLRPWVEYFDPAEYHGIDLREGKDVDEVLDACDLLEAHGPKRWDVIICLEMLEHCERWIEATYQMKESLAVDGWLLITTRSPGYAFHAPPDHWRFTKEILGEALADLDNLEAWDDPGYVDPPAVDCVGGFAVRTNYYNQPGVFVRGKRIGDVSRLTAQAEPAPAEVPGPQVVSGGI